MNCATDLRTARRRSDARDIWMAGVSAVHGGRLVEHALRIEGDLLVAGAARVPWRGLRRVLVVGGGKAGAAMAAAVEDVLGASLLGRPELTGIVNVPRDQAVRLARIELVAARSTHENRPTGAAAAATARMLDLVRSAGPDDLILCLLSGGASALLPAPAPGLSLADKQAVTDLLLASGASIEKMNAVRKHLSAIKGGRLAAAAGEAQVLGLVLSDVVGDPLDVIASGPTAPDRSTYAGALRVLESYRLERRVPVPVLTHLRRGVAGELPETPKRLGPNVSNVLIGNQEAALRAAEVRAEAMGYRVLRMDPDLEGESRDAGARLVERAEELRPIAAAEGCSVCLLGGGETTVTLRGRPGRGGPNQELALAAAVLLARAGFADMLLLSGGTDGEDGPTDAAGAWVDEALLAAAERTGVDPSIYLDAHDAYAFFDRFGGLLRTGPTHTNVMDLRVVLIDPPG